jgi:hypothetical protein
MGIEELHDLVPPLDGAGDALEPAFRLVGARLELIAAPATAASTARPPRVRRLDPPREPADQRESDEDHHDER